MADSVIVHRLGLKSRHNDIQPAESALGDEPCTLGRAPRCSVQIPRALVSRLHAQIRPYGPRYQLVDEGGSNGIFVLQHTPSAACSDAITGGWRRRQHPQPGPLSALAPTRLIGITLLLLL